MSGNHSRKSKMNRYQLCKVTHSEWDEFLELSPQASVFCTSWFLSCYSGRCDYWVLRDDTEEMVAGTPILHDETGKTYLETAPYSMYVGPVMGEKTSMWPHHKKGKAIPEILQYLILELLKIYRHLALSFHHDHKDLRGVQWVCYAPEFKGTMAMELRYTADIKIPADSEAMTWLSEMRSVRRQEINKTKRLGFTSESVTNVEAMTEIYKKTFSRQEISIDESHQNLVNSIATKAIRGGYGLMTAVRDKQGCLCSAYLFLIFKDKAYYLFGANDPEFRKLSPSTQLMYDSVMLLHQHGIKTLDFCGVNSPNRGDYKTSFNAITAPYYNVLIKR